MLWHPIVLYVYGGVIGGIESDRALMTDNTLCIVMPLSSNPTQHVRYVTISTASEDGSEDAMGVVAV